MKPSILKTSLCWKTLHHYTALILGTPSINVNYPLLKKNADVYFIIEKKTYLNTRSDLLSAL